MKKVENYLLTVYAGPVNIHGYLMSSDKRSIDAARNRLLDTVEQLGLLAFPIMLETHLTTGVEPVRKIVESLSEEAKALLAKATDYHLSIFSTPTDSPEDKVLMEIH